MKRYKKSTSKIWDLFKNFVDGGIYKARCKDTGQVYFCEHGTSNMWRHMLLKHGKNVADDELENGPFDQKNYHDLMGKAIVKYNILFSYAEYEGVSKVHIYLNPKVQYISRNTIKSDILDAYMI